MRYNKKEATKLAHKIIKRNLKKTMTENEICTFALAIAIVKQRMYDGFGLGYNVELDKTDFLTIKKRRNS